MHMHPEHLRVWMDQRHESLRHEAQHARLRGPAAPHLGLRPRMAELLHRLADALEPRLRPRPTEICEAC